LLVHAGGSRPPRRLGGAGEAVTGKRLEAKKKNPAGRPVGGRLTENCPAKQGGREV